MTVLLQAQDGGVIIPVRVHAGARRRGVAGERDGALRVDVTAAPEKGKANRAVADILADVFEIAKSSVELVSGATSADKRFLLSGVDTATAERLLAAALPSARGPGDA